MRSNFNTYFTKSYKLINYLDFFRIGVTFNFKGQNKSSTKIGKLFTLIILFLLMYTFVKSDMIQKTNPNVLNQQIEIQQRPQIILDQSNYTTVFSVSDDYNINYLIDPTIWNFQAIQIVAKGDSSMFNETFKEFHLCTLDDFTRNPEIYHKYKFSNAYCLDDKKLDISGYWDETDVRYFNINVLKCINKTDSDIICKSQDEIEKFFSSKYFGIWVEKTNIEIQNYEKPINSLIQIYYETIDNRFCKILYLFLQKTFLYTNNGLFFDEIETIETFSNGETKISYSSPREDSIFGFLIYSDCKTRYISRSYQHVGDLFGKIGGLANILIVFGFILAKFENSLNLTNSAINNLYKFQWIKNENGRSNSVWDRKSIIITDKLNQIIKPKKRKIKIGIFRYLFLLLSSNSQKKNKRDILFLSAEQNFKKDLDLIEVLRKLQDVDRLKSILLDESQKLLFDFIAKPLITYDNENLKFFKNFKSLRSMSTGFNQLEKDNLLKHYELLKKKKNHSEIDRRILALLDKNFEKTIENLEKKKKIVFENKIVRF